MATFLCTYTAPRCSQTSRPSMLLLSAIKIRMIYVNVYCVCNACSAILHKLCVIKEQLKDSNAVRPRSGYISVDRWFDGSFNCNAVIRLPLSVITNARTMSGLVGGQWRTVIRSDRPTVRLQHIGHDFYHCLGKDVLALVVHKQCQTESIWIQERQLSQADQRRFLGVARGPRPPVRTLPPLCPPNETGCN